LGAGGREFESRRPDQISTGFKRVDPPSGIVFLLFVPLN
jgi:hypothetical protein